MFSLKNIINSQLENKEYSGASKKNPEPPRHLIPFNKKLQQELNHRGIVDLTALLWEQHCKGEIDLNLPFCFGRDREILQISVLLSTVEKPGNIIITGQTGCGKTILIYELARQILIPPKEKECLFSGQHILLMTEENSKRQRVVSAETLHFLSEEIGKKAILIFDECHNNLTSELPNFTGFRDLINLDFNNLSEKCKPLLAQNTLSIIGLTDRLGGFLDHDPARQRRFSVIQLKELSIESTIDVIRKKRFEEKYSQQFNRNVAVDEEALRTAIYLSMAYYKNSNLPSKAYLILDPAVSWYLKTHPECGTVPPQAMIDYMIVVLGYKKEEVEENLSEMVDLANSPIPPHEPLAKYTTNVSSMARRGKLAPAWGREKIIESLGMIFAQEEFNNVLLTAPAGAGKTRIAEGLAYAIHIGELRRLEGKEVLLINWELAKSNLADFLKSARKYHGKFILVIDEAHRLAGGGFNFTGEFPQIGNIGNLLSNPMSAISDVVGSQSSGGALNDLKEAMGRGELPSLLLTTNQEAEALLCDPAIKRRVERKKLDFLTKEQIEKILQNEMPTMSLRYNMDLDLDASAAEAIYYLSKLLYKREFQPSASFKLLHGICSFALEKGINHITPDVVFEGVARKEGMEANSVKEIFQREKDADHPSSRRIPEDEALKRFSDDWTKEARMRRPSGYVGQETAFLSMQRALARATCNNVLLIGKAGTGKTTLVRRLAEFMVSEDEALIPRPLRNKPLLALRFGELREDRKAFSEFVASAKAYGGQYVLFIDEIHLLLSSAGNPLLPNSEMEELKPLLADGAITLIGATTEEDLSQIRLNHAVQRRFTAIEVLPPSREEAVRMLEAKQIEMESQISARLEQDVRFTTNALRKAVSLADPEQLPASAISILEIGAVKAQAEATADSGVLVTQGKLNAANESYFDRLEQPPDVSMGDALRLFNMAHGMMGGSSSRRGSSSSSFWHSLGRNLLAFITWPFRRLASFLS